MKGKSDTWNARWFAFVLVLLYILLEISGLALQISVGTSTFGVVMPAQFLEAVVISIWAFVGFMIISRQPSHPIGWIWLVMPILVSLDIFAWGYAYYGYIAHPGSLPVVNIMIVWLYVLPRGTLDIYLITLLLLLFPTGQPLSRRWGFIGWIGAVAAAVAVLVNVLAPVSVAYFPFPTDLLGVSASIRTTLDPLRYMSVTLIILSLLSATVSLFIRLKNSTGLERQQIKWFVYSVVFLTPGFLLSILGGSDPNSSLFKFFWIGNAMVLFSFAGISIASAIAILRYRLWDIDILIRRTLIYGILTFTLALIYFAIVVLLQQIMQNFTGGESPLVIVASTLVTAALFSPLRGRIQDFIDRRFYRRKYDAEQTLSEFALLVRDQIELDHLVAALQKAIRDTVQPEILTIWFKER